MLELHASVLGVHGFIRWFILSLGVVGAARSLVSLLTREARFVRLDVGLGNAYAGLLDLQALLGVLLIVTSLIAAIPMTLTQWLHPVIMLPAVALGHFNRRVRARPDRERHRVQLGIFLGTLAFIFLGLLVIGQLVMP